MEKIHVMKSLHEVTYNKCCSAVTSWWRWGKRACTLGGTLQGVTFWRANAKIQNSEKGSICLIAHRPKQ